MKKLYMALFLLSTTVHAFEWREFLGALLQGKLQLSSEDNGYDLTETQAHEYVAAIVDLFSETIGYRLQKRTSQDLAFLIKQAVHRAHQPYITARGKTYSKELINQYVVRMCIEYCEKSAFTYAYQKGTNQQLAQKIAQRVHNQLLTRFDYRTLDFQQLMPFLDEGVRRFVDKELAAIQQQVSQNKMVHSSKAQPIMQKKAKKSSPTKKRSSDAQWDDAVITP